MKDLPISLMFYCFPLVSIVARLAGFGQINYDIVWAPAFVVSLILSIGALFWKKYVAIIVWVTIFLFMKYGLPLLLYSNVQLYPWAMDCKWVVYLFFSLLWINKYGLPSGEVIYKGSLFFSKIYIVYIIYTILIGDLSREGVLMEANYDGYMILMGFCMIDKYKGGKKEWALFILATFLTLSRTGIIAFVLLLLYRRARRNLFYLVPILPLLAGFVYFAIMLRGSDDVGHLDRFVFFNQAFVYLSETSIWNVLLGSTPGISLDMPVVDGFQWYINNFEEIRGLTGIYPFYFHSTYLRLAMTWGVVVAFAYILFFVYKSFTSKILAMRYFSLLVLVQSISLSVLTLQNVSVLFFMMLIMLISEERNYKMLLVKNTNS